nr:hypothetical protein [Paracoccaceae bacterium]
MFRFALASRVAAALLVWLFAPSASADTQSSVWVTNNLQFEQPTDIGLCQYMDFGVIAGLYYNGRTAFSRMDFTGPYTRRCVDSYNFTVDIRQICRVRNAQGQVVSTFNADFCPSEHIPCPTNRCEASESSSGSDGVVVNKGIGNPTSIPDREKVERSVDWVSPKDGRFRISRLYHSDSLLISRFLAHDVRDGLGGVWRFGYDDLIQRGSNQGLDAGKYVYSDGAGYSLFFDQTTFAASRLGHSFTMAAAGSQLVVQDGSGARKYFSEDAAGYFNLERIAWPDGYTLTFERGPDSRLMAFEDNRSQRAEVVWTTAATPNLSLPLISGFRIDTDFDGVTLAPDVEISYTYAQNTWVPYRPVILRVTALDVATGLSETQFVYNYYVDRRAYPPKLFSVRDGRRNSSGQEFDYLTVTYAYDGWVGPVERTQRAGGADRHDFSRLADGRIRVVNPLGRETLYTFSGTGADRRMTSVAGTQSDNALATTESLLHGPNALISEKIERNGSRTTFTRDSRGFLLTRTEDADGPNPRVTSYTWHPAFKKPLTRETESLRETFVYDPDGLLTSYTQTDILPVSPSVGATRTWTYGYTTLASGLKVLTSVDGPGDPTSVLDVTTFTYNADGTLASTTDPNGLTTQYTAYSTLGQVAAVTAPDGIEWVFTYDFEGRATSATRGPSSASPATWSFDYDEAGLLASSTNSAGETWTFQYDGARRLTRATNPSGTYVSYSHDAMGNVTQTRQHDAAGAQQFSVSAEFDELGRLMRSVGAEVVGFSYDAEDNLIESTDAFGFARRQFHDALNRIVEEVDEDGSTTLLERNDAGQVTRYTDPRSIDTTMVYNGFGEIVSETSADRGTITYTHDSRGLVTSMTDGRGIVTTYEYDAGGRLTAKRFPSDSSLDQVFTYGTDATPSAGKLVSVTDGSGSTSYTHGADDGLPASKTQTVGLATYAIGMDHDSEGRLARLEYPSGGAVTYAYDADGRITGLSYESGEVDPVTGLPHPPIPIVSGATYLPNGPLAALTYGDGSTLNESYDSSYRLTRQLDDLGGTLLRDMTYTWSNRGNLTGVTDALDLDSSEAYGYTPDQRLARAAGLWGGEAFTYDAVGNRTSRSTGTLAAAPGIGSGGSGAASGDPHWNAVTFLAGFENDYGDESTSGIMPASIPIAPQMVEARSAAARLGSLGLAVNAEQQTGGYVSYGPTAASDFGTGDFTIEGFARSTFTGSTAYHAILGTNGGGTGTWAVVLNPATSTKVSFLVDGFPAVVGTSNQGGYAGSGWFHFAVSRNGDVLRLFVNGSLESKTTGWAARSVGNNGMNFIVGGSNLAAAWRWRGYLDELRVTKGVGRYNSDAAIGVPMAPHPRGSGDPHWSSVSYLAGFESGLADESPLALAPAFVPPTLPWVDRRAAAARAGSLGLTVNAELQEGGFIDYGVQGGMHFGTGDFTIEGFAKVNSNIKEAPILGNNWFGAAGAWSVYLTAGTGSWEVNRVAFRVADGVYGGAGDSYLFGTTDLNQQPFHFAVSRNGDVLRLFVNGVMEAKSTGWANRSVGTMTSSLRVGADHEGPNYRLQGHADELRVTKGVGRYDSDASFPVPTAPYPRQGPLEGSGDTGAAVVSQHVPPASAAGVTSETATMPLGEAYAGRHVLLNVAWAGTSPAEIASVTVDGAPATRLHRLNGPASDNAELWTVPKPAGTEAAVTVTWTAAIRHRHLTLSTAPLGDYALTSVGSAMPDGAGRFAMAGLTLPAGAFVTGGTLGRAYADAEAAQFDPSAVFAWTARDQRTATGTGTGASRLQSHAFAFLNPTTGPATYQPSGPVPFYAVVFAPVGSFLDPATIQTDTYIYPASSNRLAQVAEAGGHTRTFLHDDAGNVLYDNRAGGGYGYAYDAAGRMEAFSINGVVQATYRYDAMGQQVV